MGANKQPLPVGKVNLIWPCGKIIISCSVLRCFWLFCPPSPDFQPQFHVQAGSCDDDVLRSGIQVDDKFAMLFESNDVRRDRALLSNGSKPATALSPQAGPGRWRVADCALQLTTSTAAASRPALPAERRRRRRRTMSLRLGAGEQMIMIMAESCKGGRAGKRDS